LVDAPLLTRLWRRLSEILRRRRKRSLWRRRLGGRALRGRRRNAAREEFDNVVDAGVYAAKKVGKRRRPTPLFSVANPCRGFFGRRGPQNLAVEKKKIGPKTKRAFLDSIVQNALRPKKIVKICKCFCRQKMPLGESSKGTIIIKNAAPLQSILRKIS
jgi:hypothetical protein